MKIQKFVFNPFSVNTYVVWDEVSADAAIIDPGMSTDYERAALSDFVDGHNLKLSHLLNTHMHIDHAAGNIFIENRYKLATACNVADSYLSDRLTSQAQMFGFPYRGGDLSIKENLSDGDSLEIAGRQCRVLQVPGHSKGHIALYFPEENVVFSGDALFYMSIGRTDLPGGNYDELLQSIDSKLMTLPLATVVLSGHGPKTTIGFERANNPYL